MKKILLSLVVVFSMCSCGGKFDISPIKVDYQNAYEHKYPEPITLNGVSFNINRGTLIGKNSNSIWCVSPYVMYWWEFRQSFKDKDIELKDVFYDEMTLKGYDVTGSPHEMFNVVDDNIRGKYQVGAQIRDIKLNFCRTTTSNAEDYIFYKHLGIYGEMEISVFWQVYSVFKKEVELEFKTKGYAKIDHSNTEGFHVLINEAFASASEGFSNNKDLQKLIFVRDSEKNKKQHETWPFESMVLRKIPEFKDNIIKNMNHVREATVLIQSGIGHGTGFFISNEGHILTNQHVIGDSEEILVEDEFGNTRVAELIRVHKSRDIAILKVKNIGGLDIKSLPIRNRQIDLGDDVYAVGSPLYKSLKNTVTKGMVSSWREDFSTNYPLIQADVDIHGGNSGGPLLDNKGNVVGVSVSGIGTDGKKSVGLNFFIPITDALSKLNVSFE